MSTGTGELDGAVAIVTGGNTGIGQSIVLGLARAATSMWPDRGWSALLLMQHLPYLALPALLDHALRQLDLTPEPRTWVWLLPAALIWVLPPAVVLHGALPWVAFLLGIPKHGLVGVLPPHRQPLALQRVHYRHECGWVDHHEPAHLTNCAV